MEVQADGNDVDNTYVDRNFVPFSDGDYVSDADDVWFRYVSVAIADFVANKHFYN